jgi:hypothetical protein
MNLDTIKLENALYEIVKEMKEKRICYLMV